MEGLETPLRVVKCHLECRLHFQAVYCPDRREKPECPFIPGNQHMLAVVHGVSGGGFPEGIRPPPECRLLFQQKNGDACSGELNSCRKSAESPSDNDNGMCSAQ